MVENKGNVSFRKAVELTTAGIALGFEKIEAAEQVKVFDNYYILHYDPSGAKNIHLTEKPKPKDPIVFGVIKGSTKLYYIADWIDEYCNLTYKDILAQGVDMKLKLQKEN